MYRSTYVLPILLLVALILSACQPFQLPVVPGAESTSAPAAQQPAAEPQPPQGLRPDAPPYGVHGPYPAGARDFSIEASDQTVDITVWYPALNPDSVKEEITYAIGAGVPDMAGLLIGGRAIADAAPDTAHGPYPLVVFSPGLAGWRQANSYLLEHLASYGFVVIASDPRGETFTEFWQGAGTRPVDTKLTIDYADQLTATDGELAGLIDTDHIAVAGHSSGGWTALVGGGAQMDFGWCAANPDIVAENDMSNCTQFVPHADQIATILGLESTPTGMWPPMNDPRVDAVIALAPDGDIWGANYEGVAALKVSTLVMAGSGDTINIPERCAYPIYEHLGSATKSLVVFENADHMTFFNQCRDTPWMLPDLAWVCSDAVWDMDRAHDLINHFVTAFLLAELKGDTDAAAALAAENVTFPGIQYETTAYATTGGIVPAAALDEETIARMEALIEETMAAGQVPGAAVGVVKDGQLVYSKGFGITALGSDEPVTPESIFSMASVGKSVVALAIMQLVEEGRIDLDASVTEYLPYFTLTDADVAAVTIRRLLSHTAGMPDTIDWMAEYQDENKRTDDAALEDYVRSLGNESLLFQPGAEWAYSNIGFVVLGDVIAKVSGQSFEAYIQEHVLQALGMGNSSFLLSDIDAALLTTPHVYGEDGKARTLDFFPYSRTYAPAGSFYSSVNEMARFAMANMNSGELEGMQVLPASAYAEMWAPQFATTWAEAFGPQVKTYGLGWHIGEYEGHRIIGNYGADFGFQSHLSIFPDEGYAVIALVNLHDPQTGAFYAYEIGNGMATLLLGAAAPPAAEESTLDPAIVAEIDNLVTDMMARNKLPGFALGVVKDGALVYTKGFGVTSLDGGEAVTPQTLFQWAETSMSFTALAVMQLVEEGRIDLDAPITEYLPYFQMQDEGYKTITVAQLLTHRSGIPDSGDAMADWETFMPEYDAGAAERWVRSVLAEKGLLFAPGTGFEYSDLGYALLGAVISAASGQPYEEYMSQHILAPLGMDQSTFLLEEVDKALLASPHVADATGAVIASKIIPYHRPFAATNNLFSNIEDMAKLAQVSLNRGVLNDQRILSESAFEQMWTPHSPTPYGDFPFGRLHPAPMMIDWGYGWFLGDVAGHLAPNTFGREYGYHASTAFAPDANLAVIAVGNGPVLDEYYAADMATDVMGMLLEK